MNKKLMRFSLMSSSKLGWFTAPKNILYHLWPRLFASLIMFSQTYGFVLCYLIFPLTTARAVPTLFGMAQPFALDEYHGCLVPRNHRGLFQSFECVKSSAAKSFISNSFCSIPVSSNPGRYAAILNNGQPQWFYPLLRCTYTKLLSCTFGRNDFTVL